MPYSQATIEKRKCLGTTKAGKPCRAWAMWDSPWQLCAQHAGRGHRGPQKGRRQKSAASYPPCRCPAYGWPHRPGGGVCKWPNLNPQWQCTIPQGTRSYYGKYKKSLRKTSKRSLKNWREQ